MTQTDMTFPDWRVGEPQICRVIRGRTECRSASHWVRDPQWDSLKAAPSCPPDKRIHVRGGQIYSEHAGDVLAYRGWWLENSIADIGDASSVGRDVTFATANVYLAYALVLRVPDDPDNLTFYLVGSGNEVATGALAEVDLADSMMTSSSGPWWWGYPLCGLILKNNGTVGPGCPILPIDAVNRGRSYMWPRDLRPTESEAP